MRDLKELLGLLLNEWEREKQPNGLNYYSGLCALNCSMVLREIIESRESELIMNFINSFPVLSNGYLFKTFRHRERVEWLKERIKELEE